MSNIQYAFGKDYISDWGIKEGLREIFQNYIDYGHYEVGLKPTSNPDIVCVTISNSYNPNNLEFLRLGSTSKTDNNKIGHHGEGLKAAFLIFAREGLYFALLTGRHRLVPGFNTGPIGETLYIGGAHELDDIEKGFTTQFHCPKDIYSEFTKDIITKYDIIYDDKEYGQLLRPEKGKGRIYCGTLYVCTIKDLNHSYNINPEYLELDRDRKTPKDFEMDWIISKIMTSYQKSKDTVNNYVPINYNSRDYKYSGYVSESSLNNISTVNVKGKVEYYDKSNDTLIVNPNVKKTLDNHPKFKKVNKVSHATLVRLKSKEVKRKKTINLVKEFKNNYCIGNDSNMLVDIDVIINRLNIK